MMTSVDAELRTWRPRTLSTLALLLLPVAVAINATGHALVQILRLPVFLDSIGTLLAGIIGGPVIGALAGLLTSFVNGITNPVYFFYTPTSVLLGTSAGLLASWGMFRYQLGIAVSTVAIMLIATVSSGLTTAIVFSGATGGTGSVLTSVLLAAGQSIFTAVFTTQFFQEFGDKLVSVIVAVTLMRSLPDAYLMKFKNGSSYAQYRMKQKRRTQ